MGGVRRSDVAIGAVLGAGGAIAQVLLAQERAAAGGSVAAWAAVTAIVAVAAVVAPATAVRWALAGGALAKTVDAGGQWTDIQPKTRRQIWTIALDPQAPRTIYVGTAGDGIFKTTTGGAVD